MVVAANARDIPSGAAARAEAGEILTEVLTALSGWNPGAGYRPLERINPGYRVAYLKGVQMIPLAFRVPRHTKGTG